jgi:hypothetical protein
MQGNMGGACGVYGEEEKYAEGFFFVIKPNRCTNVSILFLE